MSSPFFLKKVYSQVAELLSGLPGSMQFHNTNHTRQVFLIATEIALHSKIDHQDILALQVAALFHDTGYLYDYIGHEEKSKLIAANFLLQEGCSEALINDVMDTIAATKVPQQPQNIIQQILCDADLAHLAEPNYEDLITGLRAEWQTHLQKHFTDDEWRVNNIAFMQQHRYFTPYGVNVLEPLKQQNLKKLIDSSDK